MNTQAEQSPKLTLPEQFEAFHTRNPQVFDVLLRLAQEAIGRGRKRLSIKYLYELARMDDELVTDGKPFKLSNSYTAFYARRLIQETPELANYLQLRTQRWQTRMVGEPYSTLEEGQWAKEPRFSYN
jgi:hypothetical protein